MYAAARAGCDGLLLSNDEMKDHLFQLLAPKYFKKWTERHQIKYGFVSGPLLQAEYPAPFSTAIQVNPKLAAGGLIKSKGLEIQDIR